MTISAWKCHVSESGRAFPKGDAPCQCGKPRLTALTTMPMLSGEAMKTKIRTLLDGSPLILFVLLSAVALLWGGCTALLEELDYRAIAKANNNDLDGAIAVCTKAIKLNPKYADAYYNRGVFKWEKGDLDGAIADFSKVIEINPTNSWAYNNRGFCRESKGDTVGAAADLAQAEKLTDLEDAAKRKSDAVNSATVSSSTQRFVTTNFQIFQTASFDLNRDAICGHEDHITRKWIYLDPPSEEEVRKFFEACGVSFPPGSFFRFDRETLRVTCRNTPPNLKLLRRYVDAMWPDKESKSAAVGVKP